MIRGVFALFVFAVALCAYIVTLPPDRPGMAHELADLADVSRIQSETLLADTPLPEPTYIIPTTRLNLVPDSLDRTIAAILTDLGINPSSGDAVISQASGVSGTSLQDGETLVNLIVTAVQDGKSDHLIRHEVNTLASELRFAVPASLVDTNGEIDTDALLDIIVNKAQLAAGNAITERFTPAPGSFKDRPEGGTIYVVAEGDSLARVAKMFYRDPSQHVEIWAANLDRLSSGYQLQEGQELYIP